MESQVNAALPWLLASACHAPLASCCLCAFVNGLILNFLSSNLGELDFSALFPQLGGIFMGNFWLLFNKKRSAFYLFLGLRRSSSSSSLFIAPLN